VEDTEFYTATMASLYARQGHYEKAAEIYRYLLEQEPQRGDVAEALLEIEKKLSQKTPKTEDELVALFGRYVTLVHRYERLKRLKKLRCD
jgi:pentatricopeptide repeat protein